MGMRISKLVVYRIVDISTSTNYHNWDILQALEICIYSMVIILNARVMQTPAGPKLSN